MSSSGWGRAGAAGACCGAGGTGAFSTAGAEDLPGDHSSTTAPAIEAGCGTTTAPGAPCCGWRPLERCPPRLFLPRWPPSRRSRAVAVAGASALRGIVTVSMTGAAGGGGTMGWAGSAGAIGSAGVGSATASATFFTAFFRMAAVFLAGLAGSAALGAATFFAAGGWSSGGFPSHRFFGNFLLREQRRGIGRFSHNKTNKDWNPPYGVKRYENAPSTICSQGLCPWVSRHREPLLRRKFGQAKGQIERESTA